ncbi:hypothetical protein ACQKFU_27355 [Bacillus mycoides]|uniref:hypothetical protein n=1 Tax=Bacillus mycoides TaxID=1405 RepID=UPI003D017135
MLESYNDLSDPQRTNINYFLDRADSHRLNILHDLYGVNRGRNNAQYRQNVIHSLMIEQIPFSNFLDWISHVELEGNNTLFVYEAEGEELSNVSTHSEDDGLSDVDTNAEIEELSSVDLIESMYEECSEKVIPLYELNSNDLNEIKLVNVTKIEEKNQLLFTIAAPSQIQFKSLNGPIELKNHIYLAYIIIDFDINSVILFMHPTTGLVSISGESKKREIDDVTWVILHFFKENILDFTLKEPEWIVDALAQITEEYFYHNNPIIEEKKEKFEQKMMPNLWKVLQEFDSSLIRDDVEIRIKRELGKIYESELIVVHERVEKEFSFDIFLQQADKGATQFKANTRGKAISHAEAGDIIRLMWEKGDILNVGLIHIESEKEYPYIIKKSDRHYLLKKYTTSITEKEVVDNVLRKLNNYKQEIECSDTLSEIEEIERGIDDFKA